MKGYLFVKNNEENSATSHNRPVYAPPRPRSVTVASSLFVWRNRLSDGLGSNKGTWKGGANQEGQLSIRKCA